MEVLVVLGCVVALFVLLFLLIWFLGAPPPPGPTERPSPGPFWQKFLMRAMRTVGFPKPLGPPEEVFAEVDRLAAGCDWKSPEEKKSFEVPLRLVSEYTHNPRMHPIGRFLSRKMVVQRLVERRQVWQAHRDHPELGQIKIQRPIFVLGFPRAGSSFLFTLLSKDPENRTLTLWEQLDSTYSKPGDEEKKKDLLKKAKATQSKLRLLFPNVVEELKHKHLLDVEKPEECQIFLQKSLMIAQLTDQEEYRNWFSTHDSTLDYEFHRANIQLIQNNRPNPEKKRWVFKCPAHSHHLSSVLKAYPDAHIVITMRHPMKIAGSFASLRTTMQQLIWDPVDFSGCNKVIPLRYVPLGFDNALKVMESDPNPDRFYICQYDDLVKDPKATVENIYKHFGEEFTPNYKQVLSEFVVADQKRQASSVRHEYKLSDFGLSEEEIMGAYVNYNRFGKYDQKK